MYSGFDSVPKIELLFWRHLSKCSNHDIKGFKEEANVRDIRKYS